MNTDLNALILVGGFGTRLRPLTWETPKPLVNFCNKPILEHQIEALAKVGVKRVILAVMHLEKEISAALPEMAAKYGVEIECSVETEPLGTAGPLGLAKEKLNKGGSFFVFNSDITCQYPLEELLNFHRSHGKEGTIMVTNVEDPTKFGVVHANSDGMIKQFVEKPDDDRFGKKINAGLYILNAPILERIAPEGKPLKKTSIERETFPQMCCEEELYCMELDGYWMDIGQPDSFLAGTRMHLDALRKKSEDELANGSNIFGNVLIHPSAEVDPSAELGPNVVVGKNCKIGCGVKLMNTTLLDDVTVEAGSLVVDSIVCNKCRIGNHCRLENLTLLGSDVSVKNMLHLNNTEVAPHLTVSKNFGNSNLTVITSSRSMI
eukprot:TRINITY_DN738_c1_g1_i1.p1 TRINITY_DN738_c1_g1~~TRINITY_DN738_c1_g1_i1.p1  ORF type:complete len:377 (+),score=143.92 TRINITY_DN738_c1_g1_i1:68-1198(+)